MYNWLVRIKSVLMFWVMLLFVWGSCGFCSDLSDKINSVVKNYKKDSYLESQYKSSYSKDPFGDAMNQIKSMNMQQKMAGVEYIEKLLLQKNCSLSQKKILSILYYFDSDGSLNFRSEIARTMKMDSSDYSSKSLVFDKDKIKEYCEDFYVCEIYNNNEDGFKSYKDNIKDKITSAKAEGIFDRCKEFFSNYKVWQANEKRQQWVETARWWGDKYWDASVEDSPYDIMVDFWDVGKLLYTDMDQPITPVFYDLPMFANSKRALQDHQNERSLDSNIRVWENVNWTNWVGNRNMQKRTWDYVSSVWSELVNDWWWSGKSSSYPTPLPLSNDVSSLNSEILVEWLNSYSINSDNALYNGNQCEEKNIEPEWNVTRTDMSREGENLELEWNYMNMTEEETKALIDNMISIVDQYAALPEWKSAEIKEKVWDTLNFIDDTDPTNQETANKIKSCIESCNGLRADQRASCIVMCACGEIDSPIFNPKDTPWLWPIFKIRFCAVPATNTKFSVWWRRMMSLEEWMNEIYGVVDKLSREWRLWIWTQQYNFLDSTTKKTKISNTVAFTIDMEFVDVGNIPGKQSLQYKKKQAEEWNKKMRLNTQISSDLDNPALKDKNRVVGQEWEIVNDLSAKANVDWAKQNQFNLSIAPSTATDLLSNSIANRYGIISQHLDKWLDQQWDFWVSSFWYLESMYEYAANLYKRKG